MNNVLQRVLLFFVMIPGLIALVLLFPHHNHLVLNILVMITGIGLAFESALIVGLYPNPEDRSRLDKASRIMAILTVGSAAPVTMFFVAAGLLHSNYILPIGSLIVLSIFSIQVIRTQWAPLEETLPLVLGYVFVMIYPGAGLAFLSALTMLALPEFERSILLLVFMGTVFFNDSAAYVFGILFGRSSPHPVRVSPKKSVVGFVAGLVLSISVTVLAALLLPGLFPGGVLSAGFVGFIGGISVIMGDLFESALKRSAKVKDSGTIIPGRGGLLDSLDSLVFSAPVFYFAYVLTQHPEFLF